MHLKTLFSPVGSGKSVEVDDLAKLWILRLLVPLGGHRNFVEQNGFARGGLALALGMDDEDFYTDAQSFDRRKALARLRKLHGRAERKAGDARPPEALRHNSDRLAKLIGLDDTARHILEFVILLHGSPTLEEAADMVGSVSATRLYHILAGVLARPESEIRQALSSSSPLGCSGLLTLTISNNFTLVSTLNLLSDRIPNRMLSGDEDPVSLMREIFLPCNAATLSLADFEHVETSLGLLLPYLRRAIDRQDNGVNILLRGSPGTGKSQLARLLAQELGCELFEVARADCDGDPVAGNARMRALRAGQAILAGRRALLMFDEIEDIFSDGNLFAGRKSTAQSNKGWMNWMLEENPVPTFWVSNSIHHLDSAYVRRFDMIIELAVPSRRQRERIARKYCSDLLPDAAIARMADSEQLAPAVMERAAKVVNAIRAELPAVGIPGAVEHLVSNTLITQGHAPLKKYDSNRLPDWYNPALLNADADLGAIADGLEQTESGRLCLYGPPGTGKTAFGRWLADRLDRPLLVKRGSDLISKWVGETERNIARAFNEAETESAVLLMDEVDSFLQDRRNAQRQWEVTEVNEMLTQMEGFAGIFIATTNLMHGIDQAALRRFDLKLRFGYLAQDQVLAMFRHQCRSLGLPGPEKQVEQRIAALGILTPGDFAAVARRHRFQPVTSPLSLVEALEGECDVKEGGRRRSIGFA